MYIEDITRICEALQPFFSAVFKLGIVFLLMDISDAIREQTHWIKNEEETDQIGKN